MVSPETPPELYLDVRRHVPGLRSIFLSDTTHDKPTVLVIPHCRTTAALPQRVGRSGWFVGGERVWRGSAFAYATSGACCGVAP